MKRGFIAALTLALGVGCAGQQSQVSTDETSKQPTKVLTRSTIATSERVSLTEQFTSEISANKENGIIPAANGVRIASIRYEVGDHVNEGDVVASLDPTLYNQQMIALANLQLDYDRLLPVYEAGGISRQMLDQAKSSLDVQREIADNIKKNIELLSPISGVVTARNAEAGDLFTSQSILNIAQMDTVKVQVQISEQFFPNVKVGMPIDVEVEIYPNKQFKGSVSLIYPALNAATRTFTAEVIVPNKDLILRPGMYGKSTFKMGSRKGVMVPDVAVQKQYGSAESFVYVNNGGTAERRRVTRGRQVGDMVELLSGVKAGEEVLTTGFSRLSDGALIDIKE